MVTSLRSEAVLRREADRMFQSRASVLVFAEMSAVPIWYPIRYEGPAVHQKAFTGSGFGVVFEDDGETGYSYATTESFHILDAMLLYHDKGHPAKPSVGEPVYLVWHDVLLKAGIFYHDAFQAVVDFKNRTACCRSGFPQKMGSWCTTPHTWTDLMVDGLEP